MVHNIKSTKNLGRVVRTTPIGNARILRVYGTATPPLFQGHHFGKETGVQEAEKSQVFIMYIKVILLFLSLGLKMGSCRHLLLKVV